MSVSMQLASHRSFGKLGGDPGVIIYLRIKSWPDPYLEVVLSVFDKIWASFCFPAQLSGLKEISKVKLKATFIKVTPASSPKCLGTRSAKKKKKIHIIFVYLNPWGSIKIHEFKTWEIST